MKEVKKKLLILGSTGMLGGYFKTQDRSSKYTIYYHGFTNCTGILKSDLLQPEEANQLIKTVRPDAILNLIGLTNVDLCEKFPVQAYNINVRTLENIIAAMALMESAPRLVHISTDQVYNGVGQNRENEACPSNYYALSKYAAEYVALSSNALVLRTNFFGKSFSSHRKSFTDWIYDALIEKKTIQSFTNVYFSPLSMNTLSNLLFDLVDSDLTGLFNLGSKDGLSKSDFIQTFASYLGLPTDCVYPVTLADSDPERAYRPKEMRMNVKLIQGVSGIALPSLEAEIKQCALQYLQ